jgi:hypothetical protein
MYTESTSFYFFIFMILPPSGSPIILDSMISQCKCPGQQSPWLGWTELNGTQNTRKNYFISSHNNRRIEIDFGDGTWGNIFKIKSIKKGIS